MCVRESERETDMERERGDGVTEHAMYNADAPVSQAAIVAIAQVPRHRVLLAVAMLMVELLVCGMLA